MFSSRISGCGGMIFNIFVVLYCDLHHCVEIFLLGKTERYSVGLWSGNLCAATRIFRLLVGLYRVEAKYFCNAQGNWLVQCTLVADYERWMRIELDSGVVYSFFMFNFWKNMQKIFGVLTATVYSIRHFTDISDKKWKMENIGSGYVTCFCTPFFFHSTLFSGWKWRVGSAVPWAPFSISCTPTVMEPWQGRLLWLVWQSSFSASSRTPRLAGWSRWVVGLSWRRLPSKPLTLNLL